MSYVSNTSKYYQNMYMSFTTYDEQYLKNFEESARTRVAWKIKILKLLSSKTNEIYLFML